MAQLPPGGQRCSAPGSTQCVWRGWGRGDGETQAEDRLHSVDGTLHARTHMGAHAHAHAHTILSSSISNPKMPAATCLF